MIKNCEPFSEWQNQCFLAYTKYRNDNPCKQIGMKYFQVEDGVECMLLNRSNEPITTIGEWSELEKGEVYEL